MINGKPLVYLDNAATSQKPQSVIDTLVNYYSTDNANVHRGVHTLSQRATDDYEEAREKVRRFINAEKDEEIIFVRGTTEGINLISQTFGRSCISEGDEIIISSMEHHSNIVPWQILCQEKGARLRVVPVNDAGELLLDEYERLFTANTRLVSIVHQSNALGTINPAKEIVDIAHGHGVPVLLDGAQAIAHLGVDVRDLGCDFYAFSGHKLYGPTGIGVLYGKESLLEEMPPYQAGGEMIRSVTFEETLYNTLPNKFEAGTPNIAQAIGLGAAVKYIQGIGLDVIHNHGRDLTKYAMKQLTQMDSIKIHGNHYDRGPVISFEVPGVHPHDLAQFLDQDGIAIRAGQLCAQPIMDKLGVFATNRASFYLYNNEQDIDKFCESIDKTTQIFA